MSRPSHSPSSFVLMLFSDKSNLLNSSSCSFLHSAFRSPLCGSNIPPPPHLILGTPHVCSLRSAPETTVHTHKIGLLVRNAEILNEPSVIHSECLQLLFLYSVVVYQGILKLLTMSSKRRKLNTGLFEMIVGVLTTCHTQYT